MLLILFWYCRVYAMTFLTLKEPRRKLVAGDADWFVCLEKGSYRYSLAISLWSFLFITEQEFPLEKISLRSISIWVLWATRAATFPLSCVYELGTASRAFIPSVWSFVQVGCRLLKITLHTGFATRGKHTDEQDWTESIETALYAGCGGPHLSSQLSRGWDRRITMSWRSAWAI